MKKSSHAEFAHFRFVRDRDGEVLVLPSQLTDEQIISVVDLERWGLARLHIFDESAKRPDLLETFQTEMNLVAEIRSDSVSRVVSWGRDGEELFYADEVQDGEPLPDYLGRTGRVSQAICGEWVLELIDLLEQVPAEALSFGRFSTQNFHVIIDRSARVRLVFSEYHGWMRAGAQVLEHTREWYLSQIFCSLLAGVPIREFHRASLPRNFDDLDQDVRDVVLRALDDHGFGTSSEFREAMAAVAGSAFSKEPVASPRMPIRQWLATDLAASYDENPEYEMTEVPVVDSELYAVPIVMRGMPCHMQLLPGPACLPREGWLNQHHEVIRQPSRLRLNQLQIQIVEDRDSVTIVAEEAVPGIDLSKLVQLNGPVPVDSVAVFIKRLHTLINLMEGQVGATAVWWLPPESVILVTGNKAQRAAARWMDRKGKKAFQKVPIKLRLHQTTTLMLRGVGLPTRVRDLSRVSGKQFEGARRSAVALPLIWFLLVGERFRWRMAVKDQLGDDSRISEEVSELLEEYRKALVKHPDMVERDLFLEWLRLVEPNPERSTGPIEEPDFNEGFDELISSVIHEEEIVLGRGKLDSAISEGPSPESGEASGNE
ncbi:MAG: hypothetical protein AAGA96_05325 [Verrucomicrobiota bacterium]